MKKLIIRIAAVLVILLIIGLVVVFFSLNSIVKRGVETVGPQLTKVEVRLGSAKLSPFSGNGELSKLFVGNPEGYKSVSAITVGGIKVGLKLSSVLSDTIVVEEVNIQAPEITFEGGLGGNNLSKILDNLEGAPASTQTASQTDTGTAKSEKNFFVKDVVINGAKVHVNVTGLGLGGQSATVSIPPIHLQNIGSRENGVTAAQLAKEILKPLLASVTKAASEVITGAVSGTKDIGKGATEQIEKATKGLKGLIKKDSPK